MWEAFLLIGAGILLIQAGWHKVSPWAIITGAFTSSAPTVTTTSTTPAKTSAPNYQLT